MARRETSPSTTTTSRRTRTREEPLDELDRTRRHPSTARASPCSFLRGEGLRVREEGGWRLGFRGTARVALDNDAGVGGEVPQMSI
jgi:hypothetical protein